MEPESIYPPSTALPYRSKALRSAAFVLSVLLHPVFFPAAMGVALYLLAPDAFAGVSHWQAKRWLLIICVIMIGFPLLSVALMKKLEFISSIHMRDPKQRILPLLASMVFYFWGSYVFLHFADGGRAIGAPRLLQSMLLGTFYGLILVFMANIFFKISMHAAAAGGMVGVLSVLLLQSPANMMVPLFAGIMLAGLIGTARLVLGEHRPADLWLGYLAGFVSQWAAWYYVS